ncbi:MAG: pyridoxamine 5'-phosphate oxidase [bacterium]|nr:pyridoxamine 5'-phosphate oxidase [bacterium]
MSTESAGADFYDAEGGLPESLPESPFPIFKSWFDKAWEDRKTPNTNAMTLSTLHPDGYPDARIVLCKAIEPDAGNIVFYTNYNGAKGQQIDKHPFASAVFHWDHDERQVRIRGPITHASEEESNAYFASRRLESRLGAWVSDQSQPIESREALLEKVSEVMDKLGLSPADLMGEREVEIPRPPHWGGFRIHAQSVELWNGGLGRIHDRARWERALTRNDSIERGPDAYTPAAWSATRLQP